MTPSRICPTSPISLLNSTSHHYFHHTEMFLCSPVFSGIWLHCSCFLECFSNPVPSKYTKTDGQKSSFFSVSFPLLPLLTPSLLPILLSSVIFTIPSLPPISLSLSFSCLCLLFSPLYHLLCSESKRQSRNLGTIPEVLSIFISSFKFLVWVNEDRIALFSFKPQH